MKENPVIPNIRQETRIVKMTFEIKKDLQEDEVVCPTCHGTGLDIQDNVYGIRGDVTHVGVHFPYNNKSLGFCKHCFNGVLRKCPGCGALRGRGALFLAMDIIPYINYHCCCDNNNLSFLM